MAKQTLWLLLLLPTLLAAQPETNLLNDKNFFVEKSLEYDKWLKASGLGKVLRMETVRVTEQALSLDLGFYTTNGDSVTILWNALKRDFEKQDRGMTLEEELFYKMLYFMEIQPTQGYVQLFNSYDTKKDLYVCFYRGIKYEDNQVTVERKGCKAEIKEFVVGETDLNNLMPVGRHEFKQQLPETVLLKKVKTFLSQRLLKQKHEGRLPEAAWLDSTGIQGKIWLKVWNLSREVLADPNPWWCRVLNPTGTGNCTTREYLEVLVKSIPNSNGYKMYIEINAKFGNGYYDTLKRGAYKNMEPEYKQDLKNYAEGFFSDLELYLKTN